MAWALSPLLTKEFDQSIFSFSSSFPSVCSGVSPPQHVPLISFPWCATGTRGRTASWWWAPNSNQRPMCGEFINPLHYYCNLQQFLVSSMAPVGMLMGHISVGVVHSSSTTVGVNFVPTVATQGLWLWPIYTVSHLRVTDVRCPSRGMINSSITTQHNVLVQTEFSVIPYYNESILVGGGSTRCGLQKDMTEKSID